MRCRLRSPRLAGDHARPYGVPPPARLPAAGCSFDAGAEFAVDVQERGRVILDQVELGDDLAGRFLFFHLFGDEPLQLDQGREGFFLQRQLVKIVDLLADLLLLLERLLEDRSDRRRKG